MICALVGAIQVSLFAVPAKPGSTVFTQPDGTQIVLSLQGDEFFHYLTNEQGEVVEKDADGFYRPEGAITHQQFLQRRRASKQRREAAVPHSRIGGFTPAPRGIVLVVQFADYSCVPSTTQASMSEMCNGDNYNYDGAYGSAKKYFMDQSNGTYIPQFDVYGPITLSKNRYYYGENDEYGYDLHPDEAIIEAAQYAVQNLGADFSLYDSNNDGNVDFIYMIYAGNGENVSGNPAELIWPHQSSVWWKEVYLNGKRLGTYACSAELENASSTQRCGIGTLCHEFSHVLGQPDYYDTEYGTNYEEGLLPGNWDLMSSGSYNNDGKHPANYTVYEKYQFGWATPLLLNRSQVVTMDASSNYYYVALDGSPKEHTSPDTVYYLENRQKMGWDSALPGHGLLIWRVVYDEDKWYANTPNNTPYEPNYLFVAADGMYSGTGDGGDPFPGTYCINTYEIPNSIYSLNQITESARQISFRFAAGCDGHTVDINSAHARITTTQAGNCYPADEPFIMTVAPKKNYQLADTSIVITMGGVPLEEGIGYTLEDTVLTIPSLTGDVVINIYPERIPFEYDHCMYYFWQPAEAVQGDTVSLSDITWALTIQGSSYRSFDSPATDRGAQFGSRSQSPQQVVFATTEMSNCLITEVSVVASIGTSGSGSIAVTLDDESLGSLRLSEENREYRFPNSEQYHGALEIGFYNLTKALFIKKIFIHFAEETENPNGLETTKAALPTGPITGIYSVTGQFMGNRLETLPQGLFFVKHTDGTEKILIP